MIHLYLQALIQVLGSNFLRQVKNKNVFSFFKESSCLLMKVSLPFDQCGQNLVTVCFFLFVFFFSPPLVC